MASAGQVLEPKFDNLDMYDGSLTGGQSGAPGASPGRTERRNYRTQAER